MTETHSLTPQAPFRTMLATGSLAQWKSSGLLIRRLQVRVLHDPELQYITFNGGSLAQGQST